MDADSVLGTGRSGSVYRGFASNLPGQGVVGRGARACAPSPPFSSSGSGLTQLEIGETASQQHSLGHRAWDKSKVAGALREQCPATAKLLMNPDIHLASAEVFSDLRFGETG